MTEPCSRIVARAGKRWKLYGWLLFAGSRILPVHFLDSPGMFIGLFLLVSALFDLWWVIDLADQRFPLWEIAIIGIGIPALDFLPKGGFAILACWVIYWWRVREDRG